MAREFTELFYNKTLTKVSQIFPDVVNDIRETIEHEPSKSRYMRRVYKRFVEGCLENNVLASLLAVRASDLSSLKHKNEVKDTVDEINILYFVMMGDFIIDAFNSDRLIKNREFIEMLEELNPGGIELSSVRCTWWDESGKLIDIDVDYIKNYEYKGERLVDGEEQPF